MRRAEQNPAVLRTVWSRGIPAGRRKASWVRWWPHPGCAARRSTDALSTTGYGSRPLPSPSLSITIVRRGPRQTQSQIQAGCTDLRGILAAPASAQTSSCRSRAAHRNRTDDPVLPPQGRRRPRHHVGGDSRRRNPVPCLQLGRGPSEVDSPEGQRRKSLAHGGVDVPPSAPSARPQREAVELESITATPTFCPRARAGSERRPGYLERLRRTIGPGAFCAYRAPGARDSGWAAAATALLAAAGCRRENVREFSACCPRRSCR